MTKKEISEKLVKFEEDFTQSAQVTDEKIQEDLVSFDKKSSDELVSVDDRHQKRVPKVRRIIDEKC